MPFASSLASLRPFLVACALLVLAAALGPAPALAQSPEQWQQRVAYEMDIRLHADRHQYTGQQRLVYTNNAPDTLRTVYYHLYFNAFRPTSMMAERNRHLPDPDGRVVPRIFNLAPDEQGWHRVRSLTQDGTPVDYTISDTVMRVDLAAPIPPGASTTFEMQWRAQVPLQTRRSGRDSRGGGIDFSMTQWYPKMAEYDERGWHADPYVGREFYSPYGTFDVRITAPAAYTLGASGLLQNPDAVGHGYDGAATRSWRPSDGKPDADSLTWHFVAENVHDFAWAADPDYVHDKVTQDGVTHHILYKPDVASSWERLKDLMPPLTSFFNDELGPYPYPQMTVAQGGDGGMEYPMITLVAGYDNPEFVEKDGPLSILGTTVHEFAHMWYYAALGTNESDYAWMDEGFTTYATEEGMAFLTEREPDYTGFPRSVVLMHKLGLEEPFDTPADWFQTNLGYGITAYPGGAMVVDMLGYVIGEEAHARWLKRYLEQRRFQHPDPFDVELFAEQVSGLKLDWYFWQFTESTRPLDDAITDLDQTRSADGYRVDLTLARKGEAVMPHDVKLTLADGSTQWVHVPLMVTLGHKPVPDDWTVTEPWPWVYPEKTVSLTVPAKVERAELDPELRTPDVNRLNNTAALPVNTRFLHPPQASWSEYGIGVRPMLAYADRFGFGGGVQMRGTYAFDDHRVRGTLTLWPQVLASGGDDPDFIDAPTGGAGISVDTGSWFDGLDYEFRYTHPLDALRPRTDLTVSARKQLGLLENRVDLHLPLTSPRRDGSTDLTLSVLHQLNPSDRVYGTALRSLELRNDNGEPIGVLDDPLNAFRQAHTASARVDLHVSESSDRASGNRLAATLELGGALDRSGASTGLSSANRFVLDAVTTAPLGGWTLRGALNVSMGPEDLFLFKQPVLGGAPLEDRWRNDLYRSTSAIFPDPVGDVHLVGFGSAGPVAYLRTSNLFFDPFASDTPLRSIAPLRGSNALQGRVSVEAPPIRSLNALRPLRVELFSGAGQAWTRGGFFGFEDDRVLGTGFDADALLADAGVGLRYDVSQVPHLDRWFAQSDVLQGLNVVATFPVWASDPDWTRDADDDAFAFRWLLGVEIW